jgi:hypothetical protein
MFWTPKEVLPRELITPFCAMCDGGKTAVISTFQLACTIYHLIIVFQHFQL